MLSFCPDDGRGWWRRLLLHKPAQRDRLALSLRQDARPRDILQGLLQASCLCSALAGSCNELAQDRSLQTSMSQAGYRHADVSCSLRRRSC